MMEGKFIMIFTLMVHLTTQVNGMGQSAFCLSYEDCEPACGIGVSRIKCHEEGYCSCTGQFMRVDVCGDLSEKDRMCPQYCKNHPNSIAKKCKTDRGKICSCFTYSEH